MATAFAVIAPFFLFGNPSGHDFEFHMNSWMEVLSQWREGIIYPRWAELAHYGFGDARFVFYPPASWMLGAALGAVLPWKVVPGAYVWIALSLSGCSMFLLARRWLDRGDAIFAAAFYAANPYFILIVYWRSAFAELLAGALLPLLLLYVLRLDEVGRNAVVPLAWIVAGAWLTNAPAAVMVNYSLALLALIVAMVRRSPRTVVYAGAAALLGAALSAFYIVPASYEQKWVNIGQVLAPGVRPQDNFLFTTVADPDHNRFNQLVSVISAAEIVLLVIAGLSSRKRQREKPSLWWTLVVWASVLVLLMFSPSFWLWNHLPRLRFLQLPWRLLLCLNVPIAFLVTAAWREWRWRMVTCLAMAAVLGYVPQRTQPPWWDNATEIAKMVDQHRSGAGYEGAEEYVPVGGDPYDVRRDAPLVGVSGGGTAEVHVQSWTPQLKSFNVEMDQPGKLVLRLFNYPAWRVEVNGEVVEAETQDDTGQMMIAAHAGVNAVRLEFIRTWDRTLGDVISAGTMVLLAGLALFRRRQLARQT